MCGPPCHSTATTNYLPNTQLVNKALSPGTHGRRLTTNQSPHQPLRRPLTTAPRRPPTLATIVCLATCLWHYRNCAHFHHIYQPSPTPYAPLLGTSALTTSSPAGLLVDDASPPPLVDPLSSPTAAPVAVDPAPLGPLPHTRRPSSRHPRSLDTYPSPSCPSLVPHLHSQLHPVPPGFLPLQTLHSLVTFTTPLGHHPSRPGTPSRRRCAASKLVPGRADMGPHSTHLAGMVGSDEPDPQPRTQ